MQRAFVCHNSLRLRHLLTTSNGSVPIFVRSFAIPASTSTPPKSPNTSSPNRTLNAVKPAPTSSPKPTPSTPQIKPVAPPPPLDYNDVIPMHARMLGYGGLIPFVSMATAVSMGGVQVPGLEFMDVDFLVHAQAAYGACILSFLGAVHWGTAIVRFGETPEEIAARKTPTTLNSTRLEWSVMPSLLAWASLLLPPSPSLTVLAGSMVAALTVDTITTRKNWLPPWYIKLRRQLSFGAIASLFFTAYCFAKLKQQDSVDAKTAEVAPEEEKKQ